MLSAGATSTPSSGLRRSEVQVFAHRYDDDPPVTSRLDNSGRPAASANVGYIKSGAHALGVYPSGRGRGDVLARGAVQRGDWYESAHRAWAAALEGGYQWTATMDGCVQGIVSYLLTVITFGLLQCGYVSGSKP